MEFQVRTVYTEEDVKALAAACRARKKRLLRARITAMAIFGVLFMLGGGAVLALMTADLFGYTIFGHSLPWDTARAVTAAVILGVGAAVLRPYGQEQYTVAAIWKKYGEKEIVFRFTPEGFWYKSSLHEYRYGYAALRDLWSDGTYYFLYVSQWEAYVLKKSDFTVGDPAAFAAAIEKWTGKEVRQVL